MAENVASVVKSDGRNEEESEEEMQATATGLHSGRRTE